MCVVFVCRWANCHFFKWVWYVGLSVCSRLIVYSGQMSLHLKPSLYSERFSNQCSVFLHYHWIIISTGVFLTVTRTSAAGMRCQRTLFVSFRLYQFTQSASNGSSLMYGTFSLLLLESIRGKGIFYTIWRCHRTECPFQQHPIGSAQIFLSVWLYH